MICQNGRHAVDEAYRRLFPPGKRLRRRGPEPDFSDSEVITIGLICDTCFHGHEELTMSFTGDGPRRQATHRR